MSDEVGWTIVKEKIRSEFPEVRQLSPEELDAWLKDPKRTPPLLIDVRERAEYEVSHLKDARHVEPGSDPAKALRGVPKDRPIVAYCSVGYRSSGYVKALQKAGYTNVADLEGSIFAWVNSGRPVFRGGKLAHRVHPYDAKWGKLVEERYRADVK